LRLKLTLSLRALLDSKHLTGNGASGGEVEGRQSVMVLLSSRVAPPWRGSVAISNPIYRLPLTFTHHSKQIRNALTDCHSRPPAGGLLRNDIIDGGLPLPIRFAIGVATTKKGIFRAKMNDRIFYE